MDRKQMEAALLELTKDVTILQMEIRELRKEQMKRQIELNHLYARLQPV